jgi:membrane protease YdiL (CAAX protease family)
MVGVVGAMSALGLLDWTRAAGFSAGGVAKLVLLRLSSGLAVGFIEETCLRGAMHTGIERESGTAAAIALTAVVYAATHFFASYHIAAPDVTAHSGLELLMGTLRVFAHPGAIADAFLALTAVGVLLGLVRAATGNIAACIGMHAGWVWVMLVTRELTQPLHGASLGFLLSRFDGFVGWLVFGWIVVLAVPVWRFYQRRAARPPASGCVTVTLARGLEHGRPGAARPTTMSSALPSAAPRSAAASAGSIRHQRPVERREGGVLIRQQRRQALRIAVPPGADHVVHLGLEVLEVIERLVEHAQLILGGERDQATEFLGQGLQARRRPAVRLHPPQQLLLDPLVRIEALVRIGRVGDLDPHHPGRLALESLHGQAEGARGGAEAPVACIPQQALQCRSLWQRAVIHHPAHRFQRVELAQIELHHHLGGIRVGVIERRRQLRIVRRQHLDRASEIYGFVGTAYGPDRARGMNAQAAE